MGLRPGMGTGLTMRTGNTEGVQVPTVSRSRAGKHSPNAEAQLQLLRGQLNPHFFFNALNSIRVLVLDDPDRAGSSKLKALGKAIADPQLCPHPPLNHHQSTEGRKNRFLVQTELSRLLAGPRRTLPDEQTICDPAPIETRLGACPSKGVDRVTSAVDRDARRPARSNLGSPSLKQIRAGPY